MAHFLKRLFKADLETKIHGSICTLDRCLHLQQESAKSTVSRTAANQHQELLWKKKLRGNSRNITSCSVMHFMNHFQGCGYIMDPGYRWRMGCTVWWSDLAKVIEPVLAEPVAENEAPKSFFSILPTIQSHSALMDLARRTDNTRHGKQLNLSH